MKSSNKNNSCLNTKSPHSGTQLKNISIRETQSSNHNLNPKIDEGENQMIGSLMQFHLNDQQPESINAKRNLEQFSIQIQRQQKMISAQKRNQDTIELLKKTQKILEKHQNMGWVQQQIEFSRTYSQFKSNQKNMSLSVSPKKSMGQPFKQKGYPKISKRQKKHSFDAKDLRNKKINISFKNQLRQNLQIIREQQVQREIAKRAKSQQEHRPTSASHHSAHQKIVTLFGKQSQNIYRPKETIRIHSRKQIIQTKINVPITFKDKQRFLKTSPSTNLKPDTPKQQKGQKKLQSQKDQTYIRLKNIQSESKQNDSRKRNYHTRTYSEQTQQIVKQNGQRQGKEYMSNPFRKNLIFNLRKNILNKKIKSHHLFVVNDQKQQQKSQIYKQEFPANKKTDKPKLQISRVQISQISKQKARVQVKTKRLKTTAAKVSKKNLQAPISSNLEQDFSALVNMLKQQTQNALGGQLHIYLNQMNNNHQYNYYYSMGLNGKKNVRKSVNTLTNLNKVSKGQTKADRMKNLLNETQIIENNTTLHYASFSSSKQKLRDTTSFNSMKKRLDQQSQ